MDKPWGHHAKWNKPEKERQILHDILMYIKLKGKKKVKLKETESKKVVAKARGW